MGKAIMFMMFVWFIVTLAGGVMQGSRINVATTTLTSDIDEDDSTITVSSTNGFPDTGFITIVDERIGYSSKTSTTFKGSVAQPMVRGVSGTDAVAHTTGDKVRTVESSMLNQSMGYKVAVLSDASGLLAFVTIPCKCIIPLLFL